VPEPPPGRYSLSARVFIDFWWDSRYNRGLDKLLANVPVTIRFSNGADITRETDSTGLVHFYGFDPSDGITVTADLPDQYRGYSLGFCGNAYEKYELDSSDFSSFRNKFVDFRAGIFRR
jgi:hypothetical protein